MSNFTEQGITDVRVSACDALLARRVESKLRSAKVATVVNRLTATEPKPRDGKVREAHIPASVLAARAAAERPAGPDPTIAMRTLSTTTTPRSLSLIIAFLAEVSQVFR